MSQKTLVLKQMRETGFVTRNWCLQRFISRLGAIVCDLKKDGMDIEASHKDGDYIYQLKDQPKIEQYIVRGGNDDGTDRLINKKIW